jgi:hypothetical protein
MHRLACILSATTLVALLAACNNDTARHEDAAPADPASSAAASSAPATASAPRASSSPSPKSHPAKVADVDTAELTINPDHIGPLKIGMSLRAAKATGLITVNAGQGDAGPDSCVSAHWKGQSDRGWMVFNGRYGLRALDSFGNQRTPEGIRPGSTLDAVKRTYPRITWRTDGDDTPDAKRVSGDALVDVVKGDGAHYRININKKKVTDVQLESDRAGCYE